jgi:hypothetical protein
MSSTSTSPRVVALAALADAAVIVVFALVGRSSHAETVDPLGVLATAWPFVASLALAWLVTRAWRAPLPMRSGAGVWAITVVVGLLLRWASGQSNAVGFVIVTTVVLGLGLLGWRLIALVISRLSRRRIARRAPISGGSEV